MMRMMAIWHIVKESRRKDGEKGLGKLVAGLQSQGCRVKRDFFELSSEKREKSSASNIIMLFEALSMSLWESFFVKSGSRGGLCFIFNYSNELVSLSVCVERIMIIATSSSRG